MLHQRFHHTALPLLVFFLLNLNKRLMYVGVFHRSLLYDWPWKIEEVVMIWLCCLSGTLKAQKCPSRSTDTDIDMRYKKPFLFIISNGSAYFCWSMSWIQLYSQYWYMYMYIHTLHQKVYIKLFEEQTENIGPLRSLRASVYGATLLSVRFSSVVSTQKRGYNPQPSQQLCAGSVLDCRGIMIKRMVYVYLGHSCK